MSLFEGSEREELMREGGRRTARGAVDDKDITKAKEATERIMQCKSDGFVFIAEKVPQPDSSTDTQGIIKVTNISKSDLFLMFMKGIDLEHEQAKKLFIAWLASTSIDED